MFKHTTSAIIASLFAMSANADPLVVHDGSFPRVDPAFVTETGQSVHVDCQDPAADYPYQPYDWPDATAKLRIVQLPSSSVVSVNISNARPKTFYSMWLRLRGTGTDGEPFGGSPLTGIPGTALLPSDVIPEAVAKLTQPKSSGLNGFWTDKAGDGFVTIALDFPIVGGAYPFERAQAFDHALLKPSADRPQAIPVAIVGEGTGAPFTLRLASHCRDGLSHGLVAGPHEAWFDWLMPKN